MALRSVPSDDLPAQDILVTHPCQYRAFVPAFPFAVGEALDVAFRPAGLGGDGDVKVGDIGGLQQGMATRGALLGHGHDGTEAQCPVGGEVRRVRFEGCAPLRIGAVRVAAVVQDDESNDGKSQQQRRGPLPRGQHGDRQFGRKRERQQHSARVGRARETGRGRPGPPI